MIQIQYEMTDTLPKALVATVRTSGFPVRLSWEMPVPMDRGAERRSSCAHGQGDVAILTFENSAGSLVSSGGNSTKGRRHGRRRFHHCGVVRLTRTEERGRRLPAAAALDYLSNDLRAVQLLGHRRSSCDIACVEEEVWIE